jgi:hypothetical protein
MPVELEITPFHLADAMKAALTCFGVHPGQICFISAAAPATTGVANCPVNQQNG